MDLLKIGQNIDAIRIRRGLSKAELARKMNVSPATLQHHINSGRMTIETLAVYAEALGCTIADIVDGSVDLTAFESTKDLKDCYPFNLATAVMGVETDCISKTGLDMALDELTERERTVLKERFVNKMTLETCARIHGVTRERIRQVEAKALRKLRHPRLSVMFRLAPYSYTKQVEQENGKLRLECATLYQHLEEKNKRIQELTQAEQKEATRAVRVPEDDLTIEDLELSVRSFNCLLRAGLRSVSDLRRISLSDLRRVRNLGRKSFDEIVAKLKEIGVELNE